MTEKQKKAPGKTGPRPKEPTEGTIVGLPIGRDKTIVPQDQVYELAAIGCTDREIANFFGVKEDTLRYNFADELTKGREYIKIRVRRAAIKTATENMNAAMIIFLLKNLCGYSDNGQTDSEEKAPLPWSDED